MYKKIIIPGYTGRMKSVECFEGEQLEEKVRRIVNNNEPITDGAPIIFTEKKTVYYQSTTFVRKDGT